jgi:hypothetical protein
VLAAVAAGVVDAHGGASHDLLGQDKIIVLERLRPPVPAENRDISVSTSAIFTGAWVMAQSSISLRSRSLWAVTVFTPPALPTASSSGGQLTSPELPMPWWHGPYPVQDGT